MACRNCVPAGYFIEDFPFYQIDKRLRNRKNSLKTNVQNAQKYKKNFDSIE